VASDNGNLHMCYANLTKYMFITHLKLCGVFFLIEYVFW